ncbi:hypothetical protein [Nocardia vermiculata]|uniref:Uncharacterized protein n=1 Tax=Nocardia vermiculata TaxID=257274 RepID=A0A846Y5A4_9NOCA|nr:hypothetical protein [Nocardia vermiculata]NKY52458.1 hypothetical protein [Nocardia vermiculata]
MTAIAQQMVAILGVVIGAGATYAATMITERTKWRRSQAARWDDKRLAAYNDYAQVLRRYSDVAFRLSAARGYQTISQPLDPDVGASRLAGLPFRAGGLREAVMLLGSPTAVTAGRAWFDKLVQLGHIAQGREASHTEFAGLVVSIGIHRGAFYASARDDLGVTSGELPSSAFTRKPPSMITDGAASDRPDEGSEVF